MAILHTDSFVSPLALSYGIASPSDFTLSSTSGRNSRPGLNVNGSAIGPRFSFVLPQVASTYTGIAIKHPQTGIGTTAGIVQALFLFLNNTGHFQGGLFFNSNWQLELWRVGSSSSDRGIRLGVSDQKLDQSIYNYIEVKYTPAVSCAANSNIVRLNGLEVINVPAGTRTDTSSGSNSGTETSTILICSSGVSGTVNYCDWYITDDQFLGDVKILPRFPTANGTYSQWTPNAGSNYQAVDETSSDGDTTFNEGSLVGDRDSYIHSVISDPYVKGINHKIVARKTDAGTRRIQPFVRHGGNDYDAANSFTLADGYKLFEKAYLLNPATSATWTPTEVNNSEFGFLVAE